MPSMVPKSISGTYLIIFYRYALVNNSVNIEKQLYYSKIHLKNIEISYTLARIMNYEVHNVINEVHTKTL